MTISAFSAETIVPEHGLVSLSAAAWDEAKRRARLLSGVECDRDERGLPDVGTSGLVGALERRNRVSADDPLTGEEHDLRDPVVVGRRDLQVVRPVGQLPNGGSGERLHARSQGDHYGFGTGTRRFVEKGSERARDR